MKKIVFKMAVVKTRKTAMMKIYSWQVSETWTQLNKMTGEGSEKKFKRKRKILREVLIQISLKRKRRL